MHNKSLIRNLRLKAGRQPGGEEQQFTPSALTVFVGPNSSGKSLALTEIYTQLTQFQGSPNPHVVGNLEFEPLLQGEVDDAISKFGRSPRPEEGNLALGKFILQRRGASGPVARHEVLEYFGAPARHPNQFRSLYGSSVTLFLRVENRAELTNKKQFGDLQSPDPFNSFQTLSLNEVLRGEVREILYRAFKKFIFLDPTTSQLRLVFSKEQPKNEYIEQGFHKEARDFFAAAEPIDSFSAGVKAYVGLMVEAAASGARVLLIDEPEAFLHPPLAQQLGIDVANIAAARNSTIFVATHSAHFVMGCLHAGVTAEIVRLTYQDGVSSARRLCSEDLLTLMRNPLLRSTGVINALFYEYVIVTESDTDRAFYQEINERLSKVGRGVRNCLFLNAQNKQTTRIIAKPLRELGIPTAVIVDVDILKEGGSVWGDFLAAANIPEIERKGMATTRESLYSVAKRDSLELKRDGGVFLFGKEDCESAMNLFSRLGEYGLFVIPGGELESWFKHLEVVRHGPSWLIKVFELMGEDSNSPSYMKPENDDVWRFMDQIASWFHNQTRKGIPS